MSSRIPSLVRAHVVGSPWAITEDSLATILTIVDRRNESVEAISAKLGRPLDNTHAVTVRDGVATIPVDGPLFKRADFFSAVSGATTYEQLATDLTAALEDPKVSAIVLAIDSPGGEVTGVSELAALIRAASERKPVVAHVEGLGASAAYWLASAATEVVTGETGILGSIGVRMTITDRREADAARGTKTYEIVSSQSPSKVSDPSTEDGRSRIQATLDALAGVFIAEVARYRGVSEETVLGQFGQGGVLVGADAVEAGLADRVASYEAVLAGLASRPPRSSATYRPGATHHQESRMERLTAEQLVAEYPEFVAACRAEGATAERDRITAIESLPHTGHEALVAAAKKDPTLTAGHVAQQILAAEQTTRAARLTGLADAEKGEQPSPAPTADGADGEPDLRAQGRAAAQKHRQFTTSTKGT
jgi:signal peptide peptidase SppA